MPVHWGLGQPHPQGSHRNEEASCLSWAWAGGDSELVLGMLFSPRAALESHSNAATSSEDESRHLLAALVKDYVRMKAQELGQETEGSR